MSIPAETPVKLFVHSKGKAELCQSTRTGTYILQSTDVNEKKHWVAENVASALWYLPEGQSNSARWMIGDKKYLGKNLGFIDSPDDTAAPQE